MEFSNVKYQLNFNGEVFAVNCTLNGQPSTIVPLDPANRHYAEIQKQVAAGDLTIADAD